MFLYKLKVDMVAGLLIFTKIVFYLLVFIRREYFYLKIVLCYIYKIFWLYKTTFLLSLYSYSSTQHISLLNLYFFENTFDKRSEQQKYFYLLKIVYFIFSILYILKNNHIFSSYKIFLLSSNKHLPNIIHWALIFFLIL